MPRSARTALLTSLLAALTACGGSSGGPDTAAPAAPSPSPSSAAVRLGIPVPSPPPAVADGTTFEITFADDTVSGDTGRLEVSVGQTVTIRVTSTRTDEVHLHGYDLTAPVSISTPGVLTFEASIPGVFEIELEDSGVQLASLQVS